MSQLIAIWDLITTTIIQYFEIIIPVTFIHKSKGNIGYFFKD